MSRGKIVAEDDEEEYVEPEGSTMQEGNDVDFAAESAVPDATPSTSRRKKKRRRINYESAEIDLLPSHERKTDAGGYAHTNKSKEKISFANRGNTPWNKGKQRSSADKAKIKAGVQARNRAIKLEKLRRLGMTEEEYDQKKKEIKYLRERVRRTKLANDRHAAAQAQKKLQAALDATTDTGKEKIVVEELHEKADQEVVKIQKDKKLFVSDLSWTPVQIWKDGESYDQVCPNGGPGGLICCKSCAKAYSSYLDTTVNDLETQRTHKAGSEVKELLEYIDKDKNDLDRFSAVARRKSPPIARSKINTEASRLPGTRRTYGSRHSRDDDHEWNLTSTIDIVVPPEFSLNTASV
eukprot:scaffold25436_cov127-Cylindrotheca_fusiformis.AAC.9